MDYVWNGISLVGVISAVFTLLVLCVPKLRKKFEEYIILKHDEDELLKLIRELEAKVLELTERIQELQAEVLKLSTQLASCKALLTELERLKEELVYRAQVQPATEAR